MSGTYNQGGEGAPIENPDQLAAYLASGCKPPSAFRIGTEHEKFGFALKDHTPIPYAGDGPSVKKMLEGLVRFGWERIEEDGKLIALKRDAASITLEPGGQFELSGAPLETVHQTCAEVNLHLSEVREVADKIGAGFLGLGFSPKWSLEETPMMPKARYGLMKAYMPKVGTMGHQMMFRSCTVQTNLDFSSEADMVKKFRVSLALQPLANALFANSPFKDGQLNGYLSYRGHVWTDTDNQRAGMLPFVFDEGMSFQRYVDWVLDVPMYFVKRGGHYLDATGQSFRDFLAGRLPALPGEKPVLSDWEDHIGTMFPEVRLKTFLEMRGADSGPWNTLCALPAFWVGLLYDDSALDAAWDLVKGWSADQREGMRLASAVHGMRAGYDGERSMQDLAKQVLAISRAGLNARARLNNYGENEAHFLDELDEIAASGLTRADRLIERFKGEWKGSIEPVFTECAY